MHAEILRAEQTLLLSGDGGEVDGVRRPPGRLRESAGHFDEDAAACAVVGSAIVDVVAFGVRVDAEVIVMGGVEHGLVGRGCSRDAAYDIGADVAADSALDVRTKADG